MNVSSFISLRYFLGRKRMFATFLSAVAVLGVALGVFALTVVMSVMTGFGRDIQNKLIGFNAHIVIEGGDKEGRAVASSISRDVFDGSMSIIEGEGIVEANSEGDASAQGVKIRGMDEEDIGKLKGVEVHYRAVPAYQRSHAYMSSLLGSELAYQLGVHPDYDDKVTLIYPIGSIGPSGDVLPRKMTFDVDGIFRSGYFEHDNKMVIIPKEGASRLLGERGVSSTHIWLKNIGDSKRIVEKLREEFPWLKIYTWAESNRKLFAALMLERMAMMVLLVLIVAIACISIVSVIFMFIFTRRKDVAILLSIGARRSEISLIFMKIGAYIGLIGTALGIAAGIGVCVYLRGHNLPLPSSYYLDHLPVVISWPFFTLVALCGIALSVLASVYPSAQAAGLRPQELLRYE